MRRRGRPPTPDVLTPREWEVLDLLRTGLTNQAIADRLGISLSGAKHHVSEIIGKLGVASGEQAAVWRGARRLPAIVPAWLFGPGDGRGRWITRAGIATATTVAGLLVLVLTLATLGHRTSGMRSAAGDADIAAVEAGRLPESELRYAGRSGYLARVDGDELTIVDGEGDHLVKVDQQTILSRPAGHEMVTNRDLSRLRLGDNVFVSGHHQQNGTLRAAVLSVNVFVTRDGVIDATGPDYLDVRLREGRLSTNYAEDITRIWIAAAARIEWLRPGGRKEAVDHRDFEVDAWISFQGFFADNGDWVAQYLYRSDGPGPGQ